jgi:hypothetical protein
MRGSTKVYNSFVNDRVLLSIKVYIPLKMGFSQFKIKEFTVGTSDALTN